MEIRVLVSGRGYHTAAKVPDRLTLADGASLADAIAELERQLGDEGALAPGAMVAVAGKHVGTLASYTDQSLADGDELVIVAPVAGG